MEYKYLLSHPTGQDSCRQPVTLIVAEQRKVHGAILGLLSRNREVFSLVPNLQELYNHLSIWVAKYERFRDDEGMCLIFVGPEQNMAFPKGVEKDICKAVDELDQRLKFQ